jgi:transcriptional regulator with XRE-family HTH domain
MTKLGMRIKELRKENSITQKELAKILNIQNTTLSQYENDINEPNDNIKIKIADYFNVSIDYLLGRTDKKEAFIIKGNEVPKELRNIGIDYMEVDKIAKEQGFTPEDIKDILQTFGKISKKNNN